jgi:hypothetical protein
MRQHRTSLIVAAAAFAALYAAPAMAQAPAPSSPPAAMPASPPSAAPAAPAGNMGDMKGMKDMKSDNTAAPENSARSSTPSGDNSAAADTGEKKAHHHKVAMAGKHKMSCYDLAWQSQEMKDCLAKESK